MTRQKRALQYAVQELCQWKYADHIKKIYLFGSYARNTHKPDSDVDIFIITDKEISPREIRNLKVSCMPDSEDCAEVDIKIAWNEETDDSDDLLHRNIKNEGVLLWERE